MCEANLNYGFSKEQKYSRLLNRLYFQDLSLIYEQKKDLAFSDEKSILMLKKVKVTDIFGL